MTPGHERIIRRETAISVIINIAISAAMFALVFGFAGPAAVRGLRGFAFDFLPQAFMVALMGSLVPALVIASRENVLPCVQFARLTGKTAIAARAVLVAVAAALALGGSALGLLYMTRMATMPPLAGAGIKMLFGSAVALLVTPGSLRHVLSAAPAGVVQTYSHPAE